MSSGGCLEKNKMKIMRSRSFVISLLGSLLFIAPWTVVAAPRSPLPLPEFVFPLYHETFDDAYYGGATDAELTVGSYTLEESWSGYALQRAGTSVTPFVVPGMDSTGHTNLKSNAGAVRFWFKPYWSSVSINSGTGPGTNVTLLELNAVANNQSALVWLLQASTDGTTLSLIAQTDTGVVELLHAAISWQSGVSHLITLDYSTTGTALFIDGTLAGEGAGTLAVPPNVAVLVMGSTLDGANAAGGDFDELGFFGRPLTEAEVAFYNNANSGPAAAGPISEHEIAVRAALRGQNTFMASRMGANEVYGITSADCGCVTGGQVYFTNFTAALTADQSMMVSFCLEGGTNWVLYGVYSSTNLADSKWQWVTNIYTCSSVYLTNQPLVAAYYMVRPPPPTMVVAWGDDFYQQCDVPFGVSNAVAVIGGEDHSMALLSDGTILAWSYNNMGQTNVPASATNVTAIAAGWEFSVALRADGKVIAWGYNGSGQSTVPTGLSNVVAIAAAQTRALALRSNGTMVVWGSGPSGESSVPAGVSNVIAIAAGGQHNLVLLANRTVTAWGLNDSGQTNVPAGLSNVVAVAAGWHHSLALKSDGTVVGWGNNSYGEISIPTGLTNVVAIAADDSLTYLSLPYSMALKSDGTVVVWGSGPVTIVPTGLDGVVSLGRAYGHALALRSGRVTPVITQQPENQYQITGGSVTFNSRGQGLAGVQYQWQFNGTNISGATNAPVTLTNVNLANQGSYRVIVSDANGSIASSSASFVLVTPPVIISQTLPTNQVVGYPTNLVLNIVASAPGQTNGFPLYYRWQHNGTNGGLNYPSYTNLVTATAFGTYSVVVSNAAGSTNATWEVAEIYPGGILIAHQPADQYQIAGGNVTFVSLGVGDHPVTYQWEFNGTNVLAGKTNPSLTLTNVQAAQEGRYNVVVSNVDGTLTSSNAYFHLVTPPVITSLTQPLLQQYPVFQTNLSLSVTATAPGQANGFPLHYQWQVNGSALFGQTSSNYTFTANSSGIYSVIVSNAVGSTNVTWLVQVLTQGNVSAWGENDHGESSLLFTNATAIAAGAYHSLAVREDGNVVAWGDNTYLQTNVPGGLSNVVAVAAGDQHSLALKSDGTVIAWGRNDLGQTNVPSDVTNVTAISAGGSQSLALKKDGTVTQWGQTNAAIPTGLTNVTAIASGTNFHLALLSDTTVVSWGRNDYGPTNIPANLSNIVALAAGGSHALALKQDGTVTAWGSLTNVPSGLSNVMLVAAGYAHNVALQNDGNVIAWGDNSYGQTNLLALTQVKLIAAGGNHSLAAFFSPLVQYPVDVTKDLLLIYNTNSADSIFVKDYYLAHRPMVSGANVLGIDCTTNPTILREDYTNKIAVPVQNWLAANPTKRPQYVILMAGIPWRVGTNDSPLGTYYPKDRPSVQYHLVFWCTPNWRPFITSINMGEFGCVTSTNETNYAIYTNACKAYIDKLEVFAENSPDKLAISASVGGYANTNLLFDAVHYGNNWPWPGFGDGPSTLFSNYVTTLQAMNLSGIAITYVDGAELSNALVQPPHITNAVNVAGYISYGEHSLLKGDYPIYRQIQWQGNSGWYLIATVESFNGQPGSGMGDFFKWFSAGAFGGTNYSSTPVGAVTHVDEPGSFGYDAATYFGLWSREKNFANCAWNSRITDKIQAVGDPFITK